MSEALRYQVNANFIQILDTIGCTLAVSVYTSNTILLVSAEGGRLQVAATSLQRPMGIATTVVDASLRLAIATFQEVVVLADAPLLAAALPDEPDTYARLLVPRATVYTGDIDAHEMAYVGGRLLAANTRFSCIAEIDARHSFTPAWTPPFISAVMPEDRCHLNGLACVDDRVAYATAFAATDVARGWNETRYRSGVLMEVPSGRVLLDGLCMPHSPRVYDGQPHVLESGTGRVLRLDAERGAPETLAELPGFARGLDRIGDVLFVGLSRIRGQPGRTPPPVASKYDKLMCGVAALDRKHRRVLGYLTLDDSQDEIFDVRVLPNFRRGAILNPADDRHRRALVLPGRAFWGEQPDS
ncbi:MAG: TIGR03032 family protein [Ancalomicrobiaceae bacterium]|nr:TIGR03032 family protein [Ancalomicrobiaceae bacterium]